MTNRRSSGILGMLAAMAGIMGSGGFAGFGARRRVRSVAKVNPPAFKPKRTRRRGVGLRHLIQGAISESEINMALRKGDGYRDAADDTRRKWAKDATKRRAKLGLQPI